MNKKIFLSFMSIIYINCIVSQTIDPSHLPGGFDPNVQPQWKIWHDEFNFYDPLKWHKSNNFDQYGFMPSVNIANNAQITPEGYMALSVVKQNYQCPPNDCNYCTTYGSTGTYTYTSSQIESICPYEVRYGYLEARIKQPYRFGLSKAFWTSPGTCVQPNINASEIDISENDDCFMTLDFTSTNVHLCYPWNDPLCNDPNRIQLHETDITNWHIYGVHWTPSFLNFYIDGILTRQMSNPGVNDMVQIKLNMGTKWNLIGSLVDNLTPPNTSISLLVDWVRIWINNPICVSFVKEPYLINPTKDLNDPLLRKITLIWQLTCNTPVTTICSVEYGTTTTYGSTPVNIYDNGTDHLYQHDITGLQPSTKYYYKVTVNGGSSVYTGSFITPPSDNALNTTFYAFGSTEVYDKIQTPSTHNSVCQQILSKIGSDPLSQTLIIHTGDMVSYDNKEYWEKEFFKVDNSYATSLRANLPFVSVKGDNEGKLKFLDINDNPVFDLNTDGYNYKKYFPYNYSYPAPIVDPVANTIDYNYGYSLDYGPVHFSFPEIDEINTSSVDVDVFLGNDFILSNKDWNVICFHYPIKTLYGESLNANTILKIKQKAMVHGVQLVIMGHENYYAHWIEDGIHFLILGNGGSNTDGIDDNMITTGNELYASTVPHFAKFTIEGDMMYVDVIQGMDYNGYNAGRIIESFAITKTQLIHNNTIWNTDSQHPIVTDFVYVYKGNSLDIKCETQFANNGALKVNSGAKLITNNSTSLLTGSPGYSENIDFVTRDIQGNITNSYKGQYLEIPRLWKGVNIKGIPSESQTIFTNTFSNQGYFVMANGAIIENAACGISTKMYVLVGQNTFFKGGGIIQANGATFRNCEYGIQMFPYNNFFTLPSGSKIYLPDRSNFEHCIFETNNDLIPGIYPSAHLSLMSVNQLNISGNTFRNTNTSLTYDKFGTGIISIGSSINVWPLYSLSLPPTILYKNKFENLYYGIQVYEGRRKGQGIIRIINSEFDNVYRGIYLNNSNSAVVTNNDFQIAAGEIPNLPYGIYLDGGKGFKIEENNLTNYDAFEGTIGIIVYNTGANNNEIYRNIFNGVNVGILPQFINKSASGVIDKGLRFFCNTFNNPYYDICINGKNSAPLQANIGIANAQLFSIGNSQYLPAGNQFSTSSLGYDYNFSNHDAEYLTYYHSQNTEPVYKSNIGLYDMVISNSCPSKTNNENIPVTQLYNSLHYAQVALNTSSLILNIWKDGGLEDLGEKIETTDPWEAYQQFNELMNISPYLSDEALMAMIENPVFTSLMVKLVMVANPQSSHSDMVMEAIYNRVPPLPESYIEDILAGADGYSPLEQLEANVAADYHLKRSIGEDIKRIYRNDTVNSWATDSLIAFVSSQPDLPDKYELAETYLEFGMYEDMQNTLDTIPSSFELNEEQNADYNDLLSIFGIAKEMYENEEYTESLTETERGTLEALLALQRPYVSQMALFLLKCDNPEYPYEEIILTPEDLQERKLEINLAQKANDRDIVFKIYPNPAYTYITVEYKTSGKLYHKLWLEIKDSKGSMVYSKQLLGGNNEELIGLDKLNTGSYSVSLLADGAILAVEKLNIVK